MYFPMLYAITFFCSAYHHVDDSLGNSISYYDTNLYWTSSLLIKPKMSWFLFCVTNINNIWRPMNKLFVKNQKFEYLPVEMRSK